MRLDDSCFIEEDGGRKILRTRAGLGSGLEVHPAGGLWTNVPVTESFASARPTRAAPRRRALPRSGGHERRGGGAHRALAAPGLVRRGDRDRQADDPHRHAAGHLPRHLPGEGLRVLDREAAEGQLQVLLGGPQPRRRRRRREVGRRGDGGGARGARRVGHHLRRLQHRPLRRRHLPRHPRALHPAHQARARGSWSASRRRRTATSALRPPARDRRQPRLLLLRDLRPRALPEICPGKHAEYGLDATSRRSATARRSEEGPARRALGDERRDHRRASSRRSRRSRRSTGSPRWARSRPSASSGRSRAPTSEHVPVAETEDR
jgi:hypothetical protein